MKKYHTSLFIFRRDLRIDDNLGLLKAVAESEMVIPCFIFDPQQVSTSNQYKSDNAIQFMVESLTDLDLQLKKHSGRLYIFKGHSCDIIKKLTESKSINAVYCNKDYTPYSKMRDTKIAQLCTLKKIAFIQSADALLNEPEMIKTKTSSYYQVFTPFFRYCSSVFKVNKPVSLAKANFATEKISNELVSAKVQSLVKTNDHLKLHGGSQQGYAILSNIKSQQHYQATRDYPSLDATTHLSAHLKFGTVSVRQVLSAVKEKLGVNHPLIRQLYWRDFFYHVAYNNPRVFGDAYDAKYDNISWKTNTHNFELWREGKTGFPIVDAGMRELNATGYMHNRLRMIVASFLTKDLHIDWRLGEKYFAQKLVDYDPALNNGNWQWAASTGGDAQPYFRIFNPWLQQKKFDADCEYIKKWVPELQQMAPKVIHAWYKSAPTLFCDYPAPMLDHAIESAYAKTVYKKASGTKS